MAACPVFLNFIKKSFNQNIKALIGNKIDEKIEFFKTQSKENWEKLFTPPTSLAITACPNSRKSEAVYSASLPH